jgi:hypothetical protein
MVLFVFNLLNTGSVFKLEHRLHGFFLECTVPIANFMAAEMCIECNVYDYVYCILDCGAAHSFFAIQ